MSMSLVNTELKNLKRELIGNKGDIKKISKDIEGCTAVIDSESEYNAVGFVALKERASRGLRPKFISNLEVVKVMKENDVWKYKR